MKEIQTDLDGINMAMSLDSSKEIYVCIRISRASSEHGLGFDGNCDGSSDLEQTWADYMEIEEEEEELHKDESDLEDKILRRHGKGKKIE